MRRQDKNRVQLRKEKKRKGNKGLERREGEETRQVEKMKEENRKRVR